MVQEVSIECVSNETDTKKRVNNACVSNEDYEARFLESLKLLNAPKWLNNEDSRKSFDSSSNRTDKYTFSNGLHKSELSGYGTKHKYDKLKQRFRTSVRKYNDDEQRFRHKSASANSTRLSIGNSNNRIQDVNNDEDFDNRHDSADEDSESSLIRNVNYSKSAHSLNVKSVCGSLFSEPLVAKSSDLLNSYINRSYSNYINDMTQRSSGRQTAGNPEGMKRSKSSYNTYSSQIIEKYKKSNESNSKSTSNLKPLASGTIQASNNSATGSQRGSSQWYRPKPLQLPAFLQDNANSTKSMDPEKSNKESNLNKVSSDEHKQQEEVDRDTTVFVSVTIHNQNEELVKSNDSTSSIMMNSGVVLDDDHSHATVPDIDNTENPSLLDNNQTSAESQILPEIASSGAGFNFNTSGSVFTGDLSEKAFSTVESFDIASPRFDPSSNNANDHIETSAPIAMLEESYDNLMNQSNCIEASYIIEDDDDNDNSNEKNAEVENNVEEYDNSNIKSSNADSPPTTVVEVSSIKEPSSTSSSNINTHKPIEENLLNDFLNKSNTTSFIFSNGRYYTKNGGNQSSSGSASLTNFNQNQNEQNLSSSSFNNSNNDQQLSEEIDDDDDDYLAAKAQLRDDNELRTFDDYTNEDEFFLISTPSPLSLNRAALNHTIMTISNHRQLQQEQDDDENMPHHFDDNNENKDKENDEDDDDDEDEINDYNQHVHQKPINMLRYQVQYELNRLSNIIEEEDFNYEEEDEKESMELKEKSEHISKSHGFILASNEQNQENSISSSSSQPSDYLDKNSMQNYKEMLALGEKIANSYDSIKNELTKPAEYKPVMKKRVYHLNRAYLNTDPHSSSHEVREKKENEEENERLFQTEPESVATSKDIESITNQTASNPSSVQSESDSNKIHIERFMQETSSSEDSRKGAEIATVSIEINNNEKAVPSSKNHSNNEGEYGMLNYLINRLNEQHKSKLRSASSLPSSQSSKSPINKKEAEITKEKINSEFNQFEKHLFEKYALPTSSSSPSQNQLANSSDTELDTVDSLNKVIGPLKDSSYVLTRSLYAQHMQVNVDTDSLVTSNPETGGELQVLTSDSLDRSGVSPNSAGGSKVITALSINEIETRKSFIESPAPPLEGDTSDDNDESCISEVESPIEKNVKEEYVLIGERSDIESLLDNKNNQLYNLIMSNSNRTNKLEEIETNLNKERIQKLKESKEQNLPLESSSQSKPNVVEEFKQSEICSETENYEIEIEVESTDKTEVKSPEQREQDLEAGLRDIAKYLVEEITQISINKIKIDALNETLNKKYFSHDLLTKHEILTSLIDNQEANLNSAEEDLNKKQQELLEAEETNDLLASAFPSVSNTTSNKNREELFDYYTNLEKNLESVREEINKLKQEAFDDLAYINEILVAEDSEASANVNGIDESEMNEEIPVSDQEDEEYKYQISLLDQKNDLLEQSLQSRVSVISDFSSTPKHNVAVPDVTDREIFNMKEELEEIREMESELADDANKSQDTVIEVEKRHDESMKVINEIEAVKAQVQLEPNHDEDDEEDTQYLSQQTSVSNEVTNGSSQIYMTPAESWQTLKNLEVEKQFEINRQFFIEDMNDDDQTDLDEDRNEDDDETSITLTLDPYSTKIQSTPRLNKLDYKCLPIPPFKNFGDRASINVSELSTINSQSTTRPLEDIKKTNVTPNPILDSNKEEVGSVQTSINIDSNGSNSSQKTNNLATSYLISENIEYDELENSPVNIDHSSKITTLVKGFLTRPTVPAPPVPQNRMSLSTSQVSIDTGSDLSHNNNQSFKSNIHQQKQFENVTFRPHLPARNEPIVKPRSVKDTRGEVPVLEKKSLDKFLKLASCNSASLLDLNQKSETSQSKSASSAIPLSKSIGQIQKPNSNLNLVDSHQSNVNSARLSSINSNQHHEQQDQSHSQSVYPRSTSSSHNYPNSSLRTSNNNDQSLSRSSNTVTQNQKSKNIEKDIEAAISAANNNSQTNAFRIPSSRHFCGRLLSHKLSSSTSSTYDNSSENNSSAETSSTSSSAIISNHNQGNGETESAIVNQEHQKIKSIQYSSDEDAVDDDDNDQFQSDINSDYEINLVKQLQQPQHHIQNHYQQYQNHSSQQPPAHKSRENGRDSKTNSLILNQPAPVIISSSSISTSSSSSPKEKAQTLHNQSNSKPVMPLTSRNLNLINKPMPTQRRSVSSTNHRVDYEKDQMIDTQKHQQNHREKSAHRNTVRFMDNDYHNQENLSTAKSQHNISYSNYESKEPATQYSFSNENLVESTNGQKNKSLTANDAITQQQARHHSKNESPYKNMSLAKSVDHLLASFNQTQDSTPALQTYKPHECQQSQKNVNNMNASNSSQMTLSKSIKDLRLFVSNSFSPSLIVRPPTNKNQSNGQSNVNTLNKSNSSNYENEPSNENTNKNHQMKSSKQDSMRPSYQNAPLRNSQQNIYVNNYQNNEQARQGNQNFHQSHPQKYPVVDLDATNKQNIFKARLKMQEPYMVQKYSDLGNQHKEARPQVKHQKDLNSMSRDERKDDALLDCILDMKPMQQGGAHQRPDSMTRRRPTKSHERNLNNNYSNDRNNYDNLKVNQQAILYGNKQSFISPNQNSSSNLPTNQQVFPRKSTQNPYEKTQIRQDIHQIHYPIDHSNLRENNRWASAKMPVNHLPFTIDNRKRIKKETNL